MNINGMDRMYKSLGIRQEVRKFAVETGQTLKERLESIGTVAGYNQMKVIKGMQDDRVSDIHFTATTGYGYNDLGRGTLEGMYTSVSHGESTLVRPQLMSGTHALHVALSDNLRPGDELSSPVGKPYDTLEEVTRIKDSVGSLKGYGVSYRQVELLEDGSFDYKGIATALNGKTGLVAIQRFKGYAARPTLSVERTGELISLVKNMKSDIICTVSNCYGEFVETIEPTDMGADMIVDFLIRGPGGGLASIGGYIVGRKDCIERAPYRLSAPELGKKMGVNLGLNQQLYQGLFLSPTVVSGVPKGAIFVASIYGRLDCAVVPNGSESRHNITQAITFGIPEGVISFYRGVQTTASVDGYVTPEPWGIPGYDNPIIMAAGAFVQGSPIELSADGPIRPPYAVYFQGGPTWYHAKPGIPESLQQLSDDGVLRILRWHPRKLIVVYTSQAEPGSWGLGARPG